MGKKQKVTTGYNYYGSMAQVVCMGPVDKLWSIKNGETVIYTGPILRSGADSDGKTTLTTTIGMIRFYWGTSTQNHDSILDALLIDIGSGPVTVPNSAYRNICYAVCDDVAFGNQTTPPTLLFEVERYTSGLTLSAHNISGEAVVPEVIYELMVNTLYGAGVPAASIDTTSFAAAAETIITETMALSPWLDDFSDVRDFMGRLMEYIDFVVYFDAGKVKMKLIRKESVSGIVSVDESDMTDEPLPKNEGWKNTFNYILVKFTDRENEWEEGTVEPFEDVANTAITGERVSNEFNAEFATTRAVAKIIARRKGVYGGIPSMKWQLKLLPSFRTMVPGQIFYMSFAKRSITNRLMRVTRIRRGTVKSPEVTVEAVEEYTRDESHDYSVPSDTFGVDSLADEDGNSAFQLVSTTPRLQWLPSGLMLSATGAATVDGFLVACNRPNSLMDAFQVWWTWNTTSVAYRQLDTSTGFPNLGTLKSWHRARNNQTWLLRIEFAHSWDLNFALALLDEVIDQYVVLGRRLYKAHVGATKDIEQVDGHWCKRLADGHSEIITATILELEVYDAQYSSQGLVLETLAGDGDYPTTVCFFGKLDQFMRIPSDSIRFQRALGNDPAFYNGTSTVDADAAQVRYVKCPVINDASYQSITDVTAVTYDRNDTTMESDGTYSSSWGSYGPSAYEVYDKCAFAISMGGTSPDSALCADWDAALYAIAWGLATDTQHLKADDIDLVLGVVVTLGLDYYNKIP